MGLLKLKHGIRLVSVDYLQLMTPALGSDRRGIVQPAIEIAAGLKQLAKDYELLVHAMSQMSRVI